MKNSGLLNARDEFLLRNDSKCESLVSVDDDAEDSGGQELQERQECFLNSHKRSLWNPFEQDEHNLLDKCTNEDLLETENDQSSSYPPPLAYTKSIGTRDRARRDILEYIREKKARAAQSEATSPKGDERPQSLAGSSQEDKFIDHFSSNALIHSNAMYDRSATNLFHLMGNSDAEAERENADEPNGDSNQQDIPMLQYTKGVSFERKAKEDILAFIREKKMAQAKEEDQLLDSEQENDIIPVLTYTKSYSFEKKAREDILAYIVEKKKSKSAQETAAEDSSKRGFESDLKLNISSEIEDMPQNRRGLGTLKTNKRNNVEKIGFTFFVSPNKQSPNKQINRREYSSPSPSPKFPKDIQFGKEHSLQLLSKVLGNNSAQVQFDKVPQSGIFINPQRKRSLPTVSQYAEICSPKNPNLQVLKAKILELSQKSYFEPVELIKTFPHETPRITKKVQRKDTNSAPQESRRSYQRDHRRRRASLGEMLDIGGNYQSYNFEILKKENIGSKLNYGGSRKNVGSDLFTRCRGSSSS